MVLNFWCISTEVMCFPSKTREYGRANLVYLNSSDPLFKNINPGTQVWMSHGDTIDQIPENYEITGSTSDVKAGAYKIRNEKTWGIQFHPEVYHTTDGISSAKKLCCGYLRLFSGTGLPILLLNQQ